MRKWGLVMGVFLLAVVPVRANDIYLSPSGSGGGTSCSDAGPYSFFNNSANWGSASTQIGPGTTVHLCSGTYSSALGFQASGTSSARITLLFEAGAIMASPLWSWQNGAISSNGFSHIVIDGGTNGVIENTANGAGMANQSETAAIQLGANSGSSSDVEIKNLTCANMYMQTANASFPSLNNTHINCIYDGGSGGNISIHDNVMHDVSWAMNFQGNAAASGTNIYNNEIYNFDHGFALGLDGCSSCSAANVNFHDNHVHDPANWDDPTDSNHHDGIHIYANSGSGSMVVNGVNIYNNVFDGSWGAHFTAELFCQAGPGTIENVTVFNNIFWMGNAQTSANGLDNCLTLGGGNHRYNNTYIGNPSLSQFYCVSPQANDASAFDAQNNVFVNCPIPIYINSSFEVTIGHWSNNIYENSGTTYWQWNGHQYTSLSAFAAACGCDSSGSKSQSAVDVSTGDQLSSPWVGQQDSTSAVSDAGLNLTSLSITLLDSATSAGDTQTPIARPTGTAAWDSGAYQMSSVNRPAAPNALTATVN